MRKTMSLLLAVILLGSTLVCGNVGAFAEDAPYQYEVIDEGAKTIRLMKYVTYEQDVEIPDEIDGYTVTELSYSCIAGDSDHVRTLHFGKHLQKVNRTSFNGMMRLEWFTVDEENTFLKAVDGILYDITGTRLIRCPEYYQSKKVQVPEGVTEIADSAFNFHSHSYQEDGHWYMSAPVLNEVVLPDTLQRIGSGAFGGSRIRSLYIPDSVTDMDEHALFGLAECKSIYLGAGVPAAAAAYLNSNALQHIAVSSDNPYLMIEDNILFSKDKSVLYCYPGGYDDNTTYRIPDGVKIIEQKAFNYSNLSSVDFNEVEIIRSGAFDSSHVITDWVVPKTVNSFWNVTNLLSNKTRSFTFLNPDCSISISWFTGDKYNVTIYGFPGSTAEEYVKKNKNTNVTLTFVPLHTSETDADIYSSAHTYISTTVQPTCTEQGYTLQKCAVCGLSYKENYREPLGHNYVVHSSVLPTCTEQGYTVYECSCCGDRRNGNYAGATGHSFTVTERMEPTCTEAGYTRSRCVFCGETAIDYFDATSHDYVVGSVHKPTCTGGGYTTYICRNCSDTYDADSTEPLGHHYAEKVTKQATLTKDGVLATACERCGLVRSTVKIEHLGEAKLPAILLTYTGNALDKPAPVIKDAKGNTVPSDYYTVAYINRANGDAVDTVTDIGQYKVNITYKNHYNGEQSLYFSVLPKQPALSAVTPKDAGAVIKWQTDGSVTGYEVLYAADSSFTNAKSVKIANPATEAVLQGLTGGKTYYVKIRNYKNIMVDEKSAMLYSAYSEVKTVVPTVPPVITGWLKKDGVWYYGNGDGTLAKGWKQIGGKWYLFKYADGSMITGWSKSGGKWYYLGTNGAMQTGWIKISGKWYYLNSSGAMVTGWQKINGKWYYFNANGDMKTGWLKDGGNWYYLDNSGAMLANTFKTINGKIYQFNSSGVCTNP